MDDPRADKISDDFELLSDGMTVIASVFPSSSRDTSILDPDLINIVHLPSMIDVESLALLLQQDTKKQDFFAANEPWAFVGSISSSFTRLNSFPPSLEVNSARSFGDIV